MSAGAWKHRVTRTAAALLRRWPWGERQLVRGCRRAWGRDRLKLGAIAYAYLALPAPELRLATGAGYRLWVDLTEYQGIFLYFFGQSLEPLASQIAAHLVTAGDTCVDVGANMGSYTFLLASRVGPSGRVFAFEPQPQLYTLLQRSVAANGWEARVRLEAQATYRQSGLTLRLYTSGDPHNSGIVSMVRYGDFLDAERYIEPETMALDDYFRQQQITHCKLLKMDIEGAELPALQGSQALLAQKAIDYLIVEQPAGGEAQQWLLQAGYRGWLIDEGAQRLRPLADLEPGCFGNYLFISPSQLAASRAQLRAWWPEA